MAASRVANATGAKLLAETFPTRLERGAGVPPIDRLAYLAEFATAQLDGLRHLVLVDAKAPVSFFAYPDKASYLVPDGCEVHMLAAPGDDATGALEALAELVGGRRRIPASRPTGRTSLRGADRRGRRPRPRRAAAGGRHRVRRGQHVGPVRARGSRRAPRHDWLTLTGGAIGQGLPVATGAAVACPDRKVINLEADGSAMYTVQALWTQAREGLDVTTIVFNNRSYAVLNMELNRVGAEPPGRRPRSCSTCPGPTSTSWRSRRGWACRPAGRPPPTSWPTCSPGHSPSRVPRSSKRWSRRSCDECRYRPSCGRDATSRTCPRGSYSHSTCPR